MIRLTFETVSVEVNARADGARMLVMRDPDSGIQVEAVFSAEDAAVLGNGLSRPLIETAGVDELERIRRLNNGDPPR